MTAAELNPLPLLDEVGPDEFETWFLAEETREYGPPILAASDGARWAAYCYRHSLALAAWHKARAPIVAALRDYHHALDTRQHGGVAGNALIHSVEVALGTHWVQGATLERPA